ncbi:heme ABC exporter ATP-binding protein CcmA [bacterium]|nr:heme ABC exporter ATP-binding protein CcmA [bacterium]MCI0613641.1 heme ABC exporter ATP-binding protein CcmA [bacterium]
MPAEQKLNPDLALRVQIPRYKIGITTILKDIQFELASGQILAILGPNGAGKTTILKCIAGTIPKQGTCMIFGSDKKTPDIKRQIGYLGHETFLYQKLSARENLEFFSGLYGMNSSIENLLDSFSLSAAANQLVESFSRGMKQRLALARTILADPRLLLLDEPFTGLDMEASRLLESTISQRKAKSAIVLTTHELQRAYQIADYFLVVKNGKQIFFGSRNEIPNEIEEFYRSLTA